MDLAGRNGRMWPGLIWPTEEFSGGILRTR